MEQDEKFKRWLVNPKTTEAVFLQRSFEETLKGANFPSYAVWNFWLNVYQERWADNGGSFLHETREVLQGYREEIVKGDEPSKKTRSGIDRVSRGAPIRLVYLATSGWKAQNGPFGGFCPEPELRLAENGEDLFAKAAVLVSFGSWLTIAHSEDRALMCTPKLKRCDRCSEFLIDSTRAGMARFCSGRCKTAWHRKHASKGRKEKRSRKAKNG